MEKSIEAKKEVSATIEELLEDFDRIEEIKRAHILGVAQGMNIGYSMISTIPKKETA